MRELAPICSTPFPIYDPKEIKEAYHSGQEQAALSALHEMLKNFIYKQINKRFGEYTSLKGDLYHNAITQIFDDFIHHYDPEKGKLTTYFKCSILKACTELIDAETHHTTSYYSKNMQNVKKAIQSWEQEHYGRICPPEFIAQKTGFSLNKVMETLARIELDETRVSLDAESEEGTTMANVVPSMEASPEEKYFEEIKEKALKDALKILDDDELRLIEVRFFRGNKNTSIEKVAEELNITESEARKKLDDVLRKLRHRAGLFNVHGLTAVPYKDKADFSDMAC